jgi:hypothetical protein
MQLIYKLYNSFRIKVNFTQSVKNKIIYQIHGQQSLKLAVKEELKNLHFIVVDLGEVDVMENISFGTKRTT